MMLPDNQQEAIDSTSQFKFNIQLVCAIVAFILILLAFFFTGKLIGSNSSNPSKLASVKHNKELEIELTNANARLAMAETTNKINSDALEQTRQTILQLEQQIYQQQKQIISYKIIISKQKPTNNLVIRDLIIHTSDQPFTYKYKLILTRIDQPKLLLEGNLQIAIEGVSNGKVKTLPLSQLTTFDQHKRLIHYSFRYMTMIPEHNEFAELVLPKDFTPKKVKITAYPNAKTATFTKEFKWAIDPLP